LLPVKELPINKTRAVSPPMAGAVMAAANAIVNNINLIIIAVV
jgi:hypothetical protein